MSRLSESSLRAILHTLHSRIEPRLSPINPDESQAVEIRYVNGARLKLPNWINRRNGKTILQMYRDEFSPRLHPEILRKALLRTQFIPVELQQSLESLFKV